MILKMINEAELNKQDRKNFIPFVNQRNHMGQIIKNKQKDKKCIQSIQIFQNLKKTSKQYFFDKKFQKMKEKLSRYKHSLNRKETNYDQEVRKCFNLLQKSSIAKNNNKNSHFYVDLNQRLYQSIQILKEEISKKKNSKISKQKQMRWNTFHTCNEIDQKVKPSLYHLIHDLTNKEENRKQRNKENRKKILSDQDNQNNFQVKISSVNRQIFRNISKQSQKMADFTNFGLKYKHMVHSEKKHPWRKWYADYQVEIFPGQTVKLKKLQKSIYA